VIGQKENVCLIWNQQKKVLGSEIYLEEKDLEKQLKYADKKQIPYAIMIDGEKLILKDMKKRTQEEKTLDEIIKSLSR